MTTEYKQNLPRNKEGRKILNAVITTFQYKVAMRPKVQIFLLSSRSHKVIISQSRFLSYSAIKIIFDVNAALKIRIMSFISRNVEMCCWLLLYLHTTTTVQSVSYIRIKINNFLINILETGCLIKKLVSPLNFLGN